MGFRAAAGALALGAVMMSAGVASAATQPIKIFKPVMPALRTTGVPLLLPTQPLLNKYHATVTSKKAGHYIVNIGYTPGCNGNACTWGDLYADKLVGGKKPAGKPVMLAGGHTGYYVNFSCGASCGESTLTVDVKGYRYQYSIKAGKKSAVVAMAGSALKAGPA
jgi:hypothetical protein